MSKVVINGSVGIGGNNNKADVTAIQVALNARIKLISPLARLKVDGSLGKHPENSKTVAAIKAFQEKVCKFSRPDGLIDVNGRTHRKLNETPETDIELLVFPGTNFKHGKPKITLAECLATLPTDMRFDFRIKVSNIIKEMYKLGIAMGAPGRYLAAYRSFEQQYDLPSTRTKAGPGESFHNYGLAADLGVLEWVDENGKSHRDFWLGTMDKMSQYRGFSRAIWKKRNALGAGKVHALSWEIIHLQAVPASTSGRESLAKCLNKAAKTSNFTYRRGPGQGNKVYECKTSSKGNWIKIGTAKELWKGKVKNVTQEQKKTIASHMKSAESIAKTITL